MRGGFINCVVSANYGKGDISLEHQDRIKRINELARKSKETGLCKEELEEQKILRQEYIAMFRKNFKQQLDLIEFVDK